AGIDGQRVRDGHQYPVQSDRVGHAAAHRLLGQGLEELLLVSLPVVVAVPEVALPDVVQRLPRLQVPTAGQVHRRWAAGRLQVPALGVEVDRGDLLVDAHVHPAQRLYDRLEAGEVDDRPGV